jgi:hypothetical protein
LVLVAGAAEVVGLGKLLKAIQVLVVAVELQHLQL